MTCTTLAYGGTEKALADWGIAMEGCTLTLSNLEDDVLRVMVPMATCTDDPIFPFEGIVVLRSGRVSGTGAPGSFSGGLIEFTGKRLLHVVDGRPNFEGVYYNFAGPWYDIQATPYQQMSAWWLGPTDETGEDLSSDVLLMFKLVGGVFTRTTSGVQIYDTLQHVLAMYAAQGMDAPFQVIQDNIDVVTPLPCYPMQDVKCSEVIEYCLRSNPDARLWFDYTTSPPTAHVQSRANCTPATVAIADDVSHESLRIVPREDLVARSVVLFFKQTNQVDNVSWAVKTKQKYGPHGLNSSSDPDGGLRVVVQTVDLQGFARSNVYGSLEVLPFANGLDWWSVMVPGLQSTRVRNFAVLGAATIKDASGAAVSLATYPNALMDGSSICPWMVLGDSTPIIGKQVTITVDATWKLYDVEATGGDRSATNGQLLEWFPKKQLTWRGALTNGVTGNYSALATSSDGDPIPAGLAQSIYTSLAALQYEGDVSNVVQDISGGIHMGNCLNLSNGRTAWATMNAQIQSITKDFGAGRTAVTIGPARMLSAGDLTQVFLMNRLRRIYQNPATRATGQSSAADNTVTMARTAAKENSGSSLLAERAFYAAQGDATWPPS